MERSKISYEFLGVGMEMGGGGGDEAVIGLEQFPGKLSLE